MNIAGATTMTVIDVLIMKIFIFTNSWITVSFYILG